MHFNEHHILIWNKWEYKMTHYYVHLLDNAEYVYFEAKSCATMLALHSAAMLALSAAVLFLHIMQQVCPLNKLWLCDWLHSRSNKPYIKERYILNQIIFSKMVHFRFLNHHQMLMTVCIQTFLLNFNKNVSQTSVFLVSFPLGLISVVTCLISLTLSGNITACLRINSDPTHILKKPCCTSSLCAWFVWYVS